MLAFVTKCYWGDQIRQNEIVGSWGIYGGEEKLLQSIGGEKLKGRHHLGDPRIDNRVILKSILAETGGHGGRCLRVQGHDLRKFLYTW